MGCKRLLALLKRAWSWWRGPYCLLHLDIRLNGGDCYACAIEIIERRKRNGGFYSGFVWQDLAKLIKALEARNRYARKELR